MGVKNIYIIRHGETEFNRLGYVQGSGVDSDLNEIGVQQAAAFFEAFQYVPFTEVITSALKRTHQSVKGFLELGIPWRIMPELNEISWGYTEGKPTHPSTDNIFYKVVSSWRKGDYNAHMPGGESPQQLYDRMKVVKAHLESDKAGDNILICMHGRAMRVFLCLLLGAELRNMEKFQHRNLCLYHLQMDKESKKFSIQVENFLAPNIPVKH